MRIILAGGITITFAFFLGKALAGYFNFFPFVG
jgi:hypothetical protein